MAKDFDEGATIRQWVANLENPKETLEMIGGFMVSESQKSFKQQSFGRDRWQARAPVNVFGVISDFAAGKSSPPARRFERRPALRDTGALSKSIQITGISPNSVVVGSNLSYAGVHQTGGQVESKEITEGLQKKLAKWLSGPGSKHAKALGHLLSKKLTGETLKATVPKRPFVGITKQTVEDIETAIQVKLLGAE